MKTLRILAITVALAASLPARNYSTAARPESELEGLVYGLTGIPDDSH